MTEEEWLTCTDPKPMLEFLRGKASDRKLRLFAVSAVRRLALGDERIAQVIQTSELYADGEAKWIELSDARKLMKVVFKEAMQHRNTIGFGAWVVQMVEATAHPSAKVAAQRIARMGYLAADAVREILGDPFRPTTINPLWFTFKVVKLARTVYEDRAFDRMPELASALDDAGCDSAEILNHCRGSGPHVRGCWVVDLVLGKD